MSAFVRLYAAFLAALSPVLALAQAGSNAGAPAPRDGGYSWLWWIAAAIVLFALIRLIFGRGRRPAERRV